MIKLSTLLQTTAPSTKIWIYIHEEGKMIQWGTAQTILYILEDEGGDGLVEHFLPSKNGLMLYLKRDI